MRPTRGWDTPERDSSCTLQKCLQGEPLEARPDEAQMLLRAGLRYAEDALESPLRWLEFWERLSALRESG
jgi:hypothetical protein